MVSMQEISFESSRSCSLFLWGSLLRRLPAIESEKFQDDFLMEYNDTLLISYLAMFTNCSRNGVDMARSMEKPRTLDDVTEKNKQPWQLTEIIDPAQCRLVAMPDSTDAANKVARLLYTNSGVGVLALGSNGIQKLWKWVRSEQNPNGKYSEEEVSEVSEGLKATANVVPQQWQPNSGLLMTNDVTGVNLEEAVPCIALSKNDSYVMSACGGKVSLFNMMTFKVMTMFMPPPPASTFLAFHPQDNNILAIGMEDSTIHIYNVRVDEVKSKLKGHQKRITGFAFSTNLNILVSSGADAQVVVRAATDPVFPPGIIDVYGQKLINDMDYIRNFGIKDGDQLKFIRNMECSFHHSLNHKWKMAGAKDRQCVMDWKKQKTVTPIWRLLLSLKICMMWVNVESKKMELKSFHSYEGFLEKIGRNLPGVHYIRDAANADSLILSLKAQKVVVIVGGYIGMEIAAAAVGWKLDTTMAGISVVRQNYYATIFAYGQTSSGKTYTMSGITEHVVADLFDYIHMHNDREFGLKFSAIEIYNEAVKDLLSPASGPLRLLDDPERNHCRETYRGDFEGLGPSKGAPLFLSQRQIGETSLNETSSGSYQILRLTVESCGHEFLGSESSSTLSAFVNFVDLAGSKRATQTLSAGTRLKEGCHINRNFLITEVAFPIHYVGESENGRSKRMCEAI
ncbi:unnamed protein product [Camellia sinensis]